MDVRNSIKNVAKNIKPGNLVMAAVIPAIGFAVNYGVKKIIEHEMKKASTMGANRESYTSYNPKDDSQTVNFVFGTGKMNREDDQTVNFIFGTGASMESEMEEINNRRCLDEIINQKRNSTVDEYESSVNTPDIEERLV